MFCGICGRKMHALSRSRFCEHCWGLQGPPKAMIVAARKPFWVPMLGIGCLGLCFAIVIFALIGQHSETSTQPAP